MPKVKKLGVLQRVVLLFWVGGLIMGCASLQSMFSGDTPEIAVPTNSQPINIESSAFEANEMIPTKFTCDGADQSPPLRWNGVPSEAQSLTLIVDDPDAPGRTFVHWIVYDLSPDVKELAAAIPADESLSDGGTQGKNDFRAIAYGGPCPPSGTHRYRFQLYALDTRLNLSSGKTKADLVAAMDGHILGFGELIGLYTRQ